MRTQLFGTKGTILCDNTSDHMTLYVVDKDGVDLAEPQTIPIEIKNHNAGLEFEVFAKTIENDEPVAMDGVQGAKTMPAPCHRGIRQNRKAGRARLQFLIVNAYSYSFFFSFFPDGSSVRYPNRTHGSGISFSGELNAVCDISFTDN